MKKGIFGFGGAAAMVHPASGYMFGGVLRRAPGVAKRIAEKMKDLQASPREISAAAWTELWPPEMIRKQALYKFGLEKLMRFEESQLRDFFQPAIRTHSNNPQNNRVPSPHIQLLLVACKIVPLVSIGYLPHPLCRKLREVKL